MKLLAVVGLGVLVVASLALTKRSKTKSPDRLDQLGELRSAAGYQ